jgi:hypothetical protein
VFCLRRELEALYYYQGGIGGLYQRAVAVGAHPVAGSLESPVLLRHSLIVDKRKVEVSEHSPAPLPVRTHTVCLTGRGVWKRSR